MGAGLFAGCDSAPGPPDLDASAPEVSSIQVTPNLLALDQLPGGGDTVTATVSVSADLDDADGDLATFYVVIRTSEANQAPLATTEMSVPGSGRIQAQLELTVPRAGGGPFFVSAFASDTAGHLSNVAFARIDVSASSEPPVIEAIDMPDVVTRPAAGEAPLSIPIVATVSDPDGLSNVAFVEVIVNGGVSLRLCDDGGAGTCNAGFGSSGDATAGDGQFTLTIQLDSSNSAGTNTFEFSAVDRSGLRSAVVARSIEVR
ncbi:MAG: hypothetical protein OXT73_08265 [Bacteroidota bacterium]|nr:hypothetical protein [Bacteroidota bacterium]